VVAAGLAVVIVGERLPTMGWAGILLILACLVCISAPIRTGRREASVALPGAEASPDTRS